MNTVVTEPINPSNGNTKGKKKNNKNNGKKNNKKHENGIHKHGIPIYRLHYNEVYSAFQANTENAFCTQHQTKVLRQLVDSYTKISNQSPEFMNKFKDEIAICKQSIEEISSMFNCDLQEFTAFFKEDEIKVPMGENITIDMIKLLTCERAMCKLGLSYFVLCSMKKTKEKLTVGYNVKKNFGHELINVSSIGSILPPTYLHNSMVYNLCYFDVESYKFVKLDTKNVKSKEIEIGNLMYFEEYEFKLLLSLLFLGTHVMYSGNDYSRELKVVVDKEDIHSRHTDYVEKIKKLIDNHQLTTPQASEEGLNSVNSTDTSE